MVEVKAVADEVKAVVAGAADEMVAADEVVAVVEEKVEEVEEAEAHRQAASMSTTRTRFRLCRMSPLLDVLSYLWRRFTCNDVLICDFIQLLCGLYVSRMDT